MKINNTHDELVKIFKNVISNYNVDCSNTKVIQNEGLKTIWKFDNRGKPVCLKRFRHTKEKIIFSVNAQRYIEQRKGLVPKVYPNKHGEYITEYNGQLFVLYEWITGRDLNFTRTVDFRMGIEGLAMFHKATKGYKAPECAKISSKLGRWPEQYNSMKKRMLKWKDVANSSKSNNSYKYYLNYIDDVITLCNNALHELELSSYNKLTDINLYEASLCHQDYGSGNAVLAGDKVYIIDLDGVTYDLEMRDLRKIIGKRAEKRGSFDINDINMILSYYEKYNKLTIEEKKILKADLLYPHWFFGTIKNMFSKNKPVNPSKIVKIAKLEKEKTKILDKWKIE